MPNLEGKKLELSPNRGESSSADDPDKITDKTDSDRTEHTTQEDDALSQKR